MLGKLSRSALAAVAVGLPLLVASSGSAYAATAAASVVTGSGTIGPGLTALNPGQNFSFDGGGLSTGVICGNAAALSNTTIHADGGDSVGSYATGTGPVTITVTDSHCPAPVVLSGTYLRIGVVVVVEATAGTTAAAGLCGFVPGQAPPAAVTSYTLACAASIAGTA